MNEQDQTRPACTPRAKNHRALILSLSLAVLGAAAVLLGPRMTESYGGAIQLAGFTMIVLGLLVASKYCMVSYAYSIHPGEAGCPVLLVEQRQGRRSSIVCQISFRRVLAVEEYDPAHAEDKHGRSYYTFIATMGAPVYQIVRAEGPKGELYIKLEADPAFVSALQAAIEQARAIRAAEQAAGEAPREDTAAEWFDAALPEADPGTDEKGGDEA